MTALALGSAPVLSTPDTHLFEDATPAVDSRSPSPLSDEQITLIYEIERTVQEIRAGRWKRIALQFPDQMLPDGPRVYEQLRQRLAMSRTRTTMLPSTSMQEQQTASAEESAETLFILGDTSYGACCVDEVAAEHVDADLVVHYGRSCLSPPSRLPVVYVFTRRPLDLDAVLATFRQTYPDKHAKIILMTDIVYSHHMPTLHTRLQQEGYLYTHTTAIVHNPSSPLPNRTVPTQANTEKDLCEYALFHISDPPAALLLTLSSRVASIHIYPTTTTSSATPIACLANAAQALRRRYALLTSLSTNPVFGILINTLSVKNYMHILSYVQRQIAAAGKKSYTFVVGKVNAAKVANFSEVGGWVVIGCWESSLIESKEFWRPMITPWELGIALQGDEERVWTGNWEADFQKVLDANNTRDELINSPNQRIDYHKTVHRDEEPNHHSTGDYDADSEEESAAPEFDLRTGRYVSHSRPMRSINTARVPSSTSSGTFAPTSSELAKRANGHVAAVGGVVSPGAEFLRSQRTWQGLGSDHHMREETKSCIANGSAAKMEQGRSGTAKGYLVGEDGNRH